MWHQDIVYFTKNDNVCRVSVTINESEFTENNEGHFSATASWTGGRRGTGSATFSEKIVNPNGNIPALVFDLNWNSNGWTSPRAYWSCGFNQAGASQIESDKAYNNWESTTISGSTPPFLISPIWASMASWDLGQADQDIQCEINITADFPIFVGAYNTSDTPGFGYGLIRDQSNVSAETYANECQSGDYTNIDQAANFVTGINEIPQDRSYFIKSSLKVNGNMTTQKGYCFQILPSAKICLYQDDNATGDASPNLHLIISEFPCYVKDYDDPDEDYTEASSVDVNYWHAGYWRDMNTGVNYTGICSTNIPIFRGQENAQRYIDGELSESDALNGGIFANRDSSIGDELTVSDIPTINLSTSGIGSFAYALSGAQLTEIMEDYLYTDDTTLQDTMKEALWAWGNNPIDFLIDCYYVPFSISHFYDTINANLKFGSYQFPNTSYPAIKETNGDRIVLFNTTFEGVYGDWRDFTQFVYDLFLPFIGFVPLDVQKYLNKQVRCEMMFDISTHNLRYYLFVDNKITDRFDGSVGINIPLMATDIVNKAKHDRDIQYGLVSDALNISGSIGQVAGGDLEGVSSGINSIVGGIKKYQELNNRASSGVHGSFSSSMNVYDISYAYLRITERQMILPSELNSVYNFPSYYIGTLNNLSGYCEIEDIQLKSNCTENEYNEIKTILKGGVIF